MIWLAIFPLEPSKSVVAKIPLRRLIRSFQQRSDRIPTSELSGVTEFEEYKVYITPFSCAMGENPIEEIIEVFNKEVTNPTRNYRAS